MKTKYYNLDNELKFELNKAYQFLKEDEPDQAKLILKEVLKEYPPSKVLERKISACKNILKTLEFNTGKNLPYIDNKGRQIFTDNHRLVILSKPLSYFKVSKDADEIYKWYSTYEDNFYNAKLHDIKYDDITDIIPSIKRLRKDVNHYKVSLNNANSKKYYLPNGICVNEMLFLSMIEIITNPKVYWDKNKNHPLYFINNNNDMGVLLPIISIPDHQNFYSHIYKH